MFFSSPLRLTLTAPVMAAALLSVLAAPSVLAATPQSITFPEIAVQVNTAVPFGLTATASSGLAVSYEIVSPAGIATVLGDTVTLTGTLGAVTLKASQTGNGTFDPAPEVYRTFTVVESTQRFVKLAKGSLASHSAGIRADGTLWTWGRNDFGQLGDGTTTNRSRPVQVGGETNWASVACGQYHTVALRTDGTLWSWGDNEYGGLGDGGTTDRSSPEQVGSAMTWDSVACGGRHTVAVRSDGTLWAWGYNTSGQLGDSTTTQRNSPVQVGSETTWDSVACGDRHTVAVRSDGTLWAWGSHSDGQLGYGNSQFDDSGTINRRSPVQVGSETTWTSAACGQYHTVAVRLDGTLWAWGHNNFGQLGDGTTRGQSSPVQVGTATNWASVAGSYYHTVAVRSDGTLWAWGDNRSGQLGDGTTTGRSSPVQVGSATNWASVAGGVDHTVAVRSDGTLWAWGLNFYGQLGNGTTTQRNTPGQVDSAVPWASAAAGDGHTVAVRNDGTLWAWGDNEYGQLGDGTTAQRHSPVRVGIATNWASVACGAAHSVAVRTDGTLWAWGYNGSGQLGDWTMTNQKRPVQVGSETTWVSVACGDFHTVAVRSDGTLWAWGSNRLSQLGLGDNAHRRSPEQVGSDTNWSSVACGGRHTVAVRSDGTLWAWGVNAAGELGLGDLTDRTSPVQVGNATTWDSVACGLQHTVAVRSDGTLWAWGNNIIGQLGDGGTTDRSSPVQVGNETTWDSVACGHLHTVAVRTDGTLWAWGSNGDGQLGDGGTTHRISPVQVGNETTWDSVACGDYHTVAVRSSGSLWTWGRNDVGQLAIPASSSPRRSWPQAEAQTVSFPAVATLSPGDFSLPASASSGLPIFYQVVGPATVSGSTLTVTGTGMLEVTAYQNGDAVWMRAESVTQTIRVLPFHGIKVFGNGQPITQGDLTPSTENHTDFGVVVQAAGSLTRTFTIGNGGTEALNLTGTPRVVITGSHATDFTVTMQPASPLALDETTTFTISFDPKLLGVRTAKVNIDSDVPGSSPFSFDISGFGRLPTLLTQAITFTPPSTVYIGQNPLTMGAYASSNLPVTLTVLSGPAQITGGTLTLTGTGTVKVMATQLGGGHYKAAPAVTRTLTVKADPTTLTLINLNQTYDGTPKPVGSLPSADSISYQVGGAYILGTPKDAGKYTVKAKAGTVTKTGTLTIAKAPLFVTADDKRKFVGEDNPGLTVSYSGFVSGDSVGVLTQPLVKTTTAKTSSVGGLYPINVSKGSAANYTLIYQRGTMVVETFAGAYEALLVDGSPPLPVGKLNLNVATTGKSFTGKLYTATETAALSLLSSSLNMNIDLEEATGSVTVTKDGIAYAVTFTLTLSGQMTDTVTRDSAGFGSAVAGRKLSTQTVLHGGDHTAVLEPPTPAGATVPAGAGWATAKIDRKGLMNLKGQLGDGTPFTASMIPDGDYNPGYRLFVQPYLKTRAQSFLAGAFSLVPHPTMANRRYLEQAGLTWTKSGLATDASYRTGFTPVSTVLMIDPWLKPAAAITLAQRLGLTASGWSVTHSDTNSEAHDDLPIRLGLSAANKVSVSLPLANLTKWKTTTFNTTNGTFTGTFELLDDTKKRPVSFSGVLRQPAEAADLLIGDGLYLLPPQAGTEKTSGELRFQRP
jgi:alpha-tubulin suppressor-like RCC1 family protein